MIVKIQVASGRMTASNQDKSFKLEAPTDTAVKIKMGKKIKSFFEVETNNGKLIRIGKELPDQGW